jgi:hypothetical protein
LTKPRRKWREGDDECIVVPIERWSWGFTYGLDAILKYEPGTSQDYRHVLSSAAACVPHGSSACARS